MKIDKRSNDYKIAKQAMDKKDATGIDKRSKSWKIFQNLWKGQYGDAVKEVTDFLGIEQCEPCKERQEAWNRTKKAEKKEQEAQTISFKEDSILSDDAKLLLTAIWYAHKTKGRIEVDLVKPFNDLYYSIYKKRPSCSSCGFMRRFNQICSL